MFEDRDADSMPSQDILSNWKTTRSLQTKDSQTDEQSSSEAETQSREYLDVETQTMDIEKKNPEEINPLGDPKFYKFIQRAVPLLEKELELAARSRAFDGYKLLEDGADLNVQKLHTLDNSNVTSNNEKTKNFIPPRVSCVTWSNAGSTIAICYEQQEHEDWCDHNSNIDIWNLRRRNFDPGQPHIQLQAPSCLAVARFHPVEPSILAGAGYTGEIFIWNISNTTGTNVMENPTVTSGSFTNSGHREKVTALAWVLSRDVFGPTVSRQLLLVSTALDGRILVWSQDPKSLKMIKGLALTTAHLTTRVRSKTDIAITTMSVSRHDGVTAILGTESGVIFQGSLESQVPLDPEKLALAEISEDESNWFDPVKSTFFGHTGRVLDLQFSPHHASTFISVGSDQEIRMYSLLQPLSPIKIIYTEGKAVSKLSWSPSRPLVFAGTTQITKLQVYDLRTIGGATDLKASEKKSEIAMTALEFNRSDISLIAGGDSEGKIHIWKLPNHLTSMHSNELEILESYGSATKE